MNILAFDTCFAAVSVSVRWQDAAGAWQQRDAYEEMVAGQAERLMPMIAEVMQASGLSFANIDRIAVTHGPGSFTGVRVGVAAARALALAIDKPIVTTTSLSVMALRATGEMAVTCPYDMLLVAVDARRGGLYVQAFTPDASPLEEARLGTPEEAAHLIGGRSACAVGSGATLVAEAAARLGISPVVASLTTLQPRAKELALVAQDLAPVAELKPLYLRPADAKPPANAGLPRLE
jgi:tRNA threonylcarbamoyladenosine biosynthesis protein TsaB